MYIQELTDKLVQKNKILSNRENLFLCIYSSFSNNVYVQLYKNKDDNIHKSEALKR